MHAKPGTVVVVVVELKYEPLYFIYFMLLICKSYLACFKYGL